MNVGLKSPIALAVAAAISVSALVAAPSVVKAAGKTPGKYVAGDFHNHTTCSDGSISMEKLIKKATDKVDTPWGLDWFVQAGHGGNGFRNCTLVEDATLDSPAYPFVEGKGPTTSWENSGVAVKGDVSTDSSGARNMWRWQSVQEFQYPLVEYFNHYKNLPLFIGLESVVAGHEHSSMSVITGQIPASLDSAPLPTGPGYTAIGSGTALAKWEYCFDRGDGDTSRGAANQWDCSVPGSPNASGPNWNATAAKIVQPTSTALGSGHGIVGHTKTLEALKWMAANAATESYYAPAHLERAGPFNPDGDNGYNVESLRDFNNTAPNSAFGMETQPGHGASANRGEYQVKRNSWPGQSVRVDSVGGTTFGGTGVYGGVVGGVWDALLGEGRNFWFFASSDWHNRGSFGPDDRRSTQDFYPGEYQRTYVLVRNGTDKIRPQNVVDGLRTGNAWAASGQLIDRLAFIACASYPGPAARSNAAVETLALNAAVGDTDIDVGNCATLGQKLPLRAGGEVVVSLVVRDPSGTNYSPYTFPNPSLAQVGINVPLNAPVLDHVDMIQGLVTGYKTPGSADYSGEWPRNNDWLKDDGSTTGFTNVPAAARNTSAQVIKTFNGSGATPWTEVTGSDGQKYLKMTVRLSGQQVAQSQYLRLRGTNMPASVPFETDANGNPLADIYTNAFDTKMLSIPCTVAHTASSQFDGCPDHLATATTTAGAPYTSPIVGQKAVSFDVAAWSDLWFYSNPIYVEVAGGTLVAGVK